MVDTGPVTGPGPDGRPVARPDRRASPEPKVLKFLGAGHLAESCREPRIVSKRPGLHRCIYGRRGVSSQWSPVLVGLELEFRPEGPENPGTAPRRLVLGDDLQLVELEADRVPGVPLQLPFHDLL